MLEEKLKVGIFVKRTPVPSFFEPQIMNEIITYIYAHDLDIFLGPEWLFTPEDRLFSDSEKNALIENIASRTKDKDTLIIPGSIMWEDDNYYYNTTPLIFKGDVIGETHKFFNGGSSNLAKKRNSKKEWYPEKYVWDAKSETDRWWDNKKRAKFREEFPSVFNWKEYKIGVEICADIGTIANVLGETSLDLYFLVSCGRGLTSEKLPIKGKSGYGLCSDGDGKSQVFQRIYGEEQNVIRLNPKSELEELHIYELS
ncbi:MAG: hypothetical protein ISS23_03640 [Nanoarchaeota archaeon]|nr:hypothetical protein [Nanoarchaeota archaeon]